MSSSFRKTMVFHIHISDGNLIAEENVKVWAVCKKNTKRTTWQKVSEGREIIQLFETWKHVITVIISSELLSTHAPDVAFPVQYELIFSQSPSELWVSHKTPNTLPKLAFKHILIRCCQGLCCQQAEQNLSVRHVIEIYLQHDASEGLIIEVKWVLLSHYI